MIFWRERIKEWYPRWRERTYFIPPVLMYHTDHDSVKLAEENVKIPKPPLSNTTGPTGPALLQTDVTEDLTLQRILHCIRKLAEEHNDVMFVMSNPRFEDYLNEPCFAAAARSLPRPDDLKKLKQDRGDFDILIIHRHYGILACEIKSVGVRFEELSMPEQRQLDEIEKKVRRGIKQLDKSDAVLNHLVKDLSNQPRVRKTLLLPYVSAARLRQVLDNFPQLEKDLSQCLGIDGTVDPISLCVTSEQLSDITKPNDITKPHDVTDDVIDRLDQWWQARVSGEKTDAAMTDDI